MHIDAVGIHVAYSFGFQIEQSPPQIRTDCAFRGIVINRSQKVEIQIRRRQIANDLPHRLSHGRYGKCLFGSDSANLCWWFHSRKYKRKMISHRLNELNELKSVKF